MRSPMYAYPHGSLPQWQNWWRSKLLRCAAVAHPRLSATSSTGRERANLFSCAVVTVTTGMPLDMILPCPHSNPLR
ncbi:Uncharacterised protein [Mycobacteroides abscessus subsp. abscessus]|nr:Uncharacterised protein [Mycobacteroides abscessus subsp. abscessus]